MPSPVHDSKSNIRVALSDSTTMEFSATPVPAPHITPTFLSLKKFYACFFSLALCIIVSALDSVVVPITIPTLATVFHSESVVQLASPIYLLSTTSFQMLYGRSSDIFGRKTSLSVAMFISMFGNLGTGFSTTLKQLLIFRAIAGIGGGMGFLLLVL